MNQISYDEDAVVEQIPSAAWRSRLYQSYVSSGQAASRISAEQPFQLSDYPYIRQRVQPLLPRRKSTRILDLGCGHGGLLFCLKSWGYHNVSGVDVSEEQVRIAQRKGVPEVICGDLYTFLQQQEHPADVVFLMDVVEHLTRDEVFRLLDAARRVLSPGGLLILHVPNASGIFGMSVRYGDMTHEQAYAARSMKQCLSVCGFDNVIVHEDRPVVHGPASLVRRIIWSLLTIPVRLLYAAESGHLPVALSQNVLVIAKATDEPTIVSSERAA